MTTHWKQAQGFRINHLTPLHPDMLSEKGYTQEFKKTVNGVTESEEITIDMEFVYERIGAIFVSDLNIEDLDTAMEILADSYTFYKEKQEKEKLKDYKALVDKYGEKAISQLISDKK